MNMDRKLAISFWIWGPFDCGEDSVYHDCEARMKELRERGFNCVRMESGAGFLYAPDGSERGTVTLHSPFGKYSPLIRQMIVTKETTFNAKERLLKMFRAADKYDVSIILSSWYYLHTNWFVDEDFNAPLFALPAEEKMRYFARELNAILALLRENGLVHRVAFAELFNEIDGTDFGGLYGNFAAGQAERIRRMHEETIDWLKERNPDVAFACDICSWGGVCTVPRNVDVINYHNYYMWPVYDCLEQGQVGKSEGEILIAPEKEKYFGARVTIAEVDRERRMNLRTGRDWSSRVALYASLDPAAFPEAEKLLEANLARNADVYLAVLRERMTALKTLRDAFCPQARLVMGEGVTYCAHNGLLFEEKSRLYWETVRKGLGILKSLGFSGSVVRTTSGPEDPSWNMNAADYRELNAYFLGE